LVPKEYAERLLATRGQVAPERRVVTILFSDMEGSTAMAEGLDPEEVLEVMDGAFDVLIEPVYRYEGTVARLMGDAVLAFFGAPVAHEDDPERAVRAALAIVEGAGEYAARLERKQGISSFNVRVGVHTGLVVVGEVGSDLRVEYTAMGDAINLASRMEQHAPPGGILITHDTYRHVRGVFDVEPQDPLAVKGKAEPVQTYLVQRAKARAFRKPMRGVEGIETRMVGREAELKRLQEAFFAVMEDGELQQATVVGEAGVGKSRLLHEFDIWAEALPELYYYFRGRAFPEMQSLPYGLLRDLIAFRFQIQDSDSPREVRVKLEEGVAAALIPGRGRHEEGDPALCAQRIGQLLGFELGDGSPRRGAEEDAQQVRDRALEHLGSYFRGMAAQAPVLILLEDLHWADDSSLDALSQLVLTLTDRPAMVVAAARPALYERRPYWGEGQAFHQRQLLEPLSKWDSRRLVAEILQKVEAVPLALRDLVVSGAEGNPFFIEELIKMLVEDGVIIKGGDQWRLAPSRLTEVRVPTTLTGVLQGRLDRLPVDERTILQQASVVGRLFWDRAIMRICESADDGFGQDAVVEKLSALRGREMVFQHEISTFVDAQEYLFKHALLREVTYESVLRKVRRIYHGMVAEWLLEQGGDRAEEYTSLIADHLELAGRGVEAADYLLHAGDRARALWAHQEAIRAYERALALLKEQGDQARAAKTLMKLGLTYNNAFEFGRARDAYEEGFALWQLAGEVEPGATLPSAPHALRVGFAVASVLDPTMARDSNSGLLIDQLFSGLAEETPEMDIVPNVAQSWEVSEGGRRYTFHLRGDLLWSDGTPLTAADFEYSWKRTLNPTTRSPNARLLFDVVGARGFHQGETDDPDSVCVRALDDTTLVVELVAPTGYFPHLLAFSATYPLPRHAVERHGVAWTQVENIVTNGPYRLETWKRDERATLVRDHAYHGRFGGNVQRVEVSPLSDASSRLELYEADGLDLFHLCDLPPAELDRARNRHAGDYVSVPELATEYLGFNAKRPPFDDPRVRRAFVLATDRERMSEVALQGELPATGGFVPRGMPGHSAGIALPYDAEQAQQLLAQAGYPEGRGFPAVTLLHSQKRTVQGDYLLAEWTANLGIEIERDCPDGGAFFERLAAERPELWLIAWTADYPDPDNFLRVGYPPPGDTGWRNDAYYRLIDQARRVTDQNERTEMYQQADRILIQEAALMPYAYGCCHLLVKPWVRRHPVSAPQFWFWKDVVIEPH
jgi:ABC-type oligopeptide transport system substrate-binding subunit/class 3 adenylate cyclase